MNIYDVVGLFFACLGFGLITGLIWRIIINPFPGRR